MAVNALHQALVHTVVIGFGKVCLGGGMAAVTQLRLLLDQQELFSLGVMRGGAIETSPIAAGGGGFGKMRLFGGFAVAAETTCAGLLPRFPFEHKYFGFVTATRHVVGPGTVTSLTTLLRGAALRVQRGLPVRRLFPR